MKIVELRGELRATIMSNNINNKTLPAIAYTVHIKNITSCKSP